MYIYIYTHIYIYIYGDISKTSCKEDTLKEAATTKRSQPPLSCD